MGRRDRAPLLYRALHAVVPGMLNALYRPEVEGLEHVPTDEPAILASNHLSTVDVVFMPSVLTRPVYFLAKSEYFTGLSRHFFSNVGVIPVARDGGDAAEASLCKGQEILEAGNLLGIYPEGTRSPDGRLYRGKTGPVRLALRTGAPIVPVAMHGTYDVMPPGARLPRIRRVGVRFGAPLDLSRYAGRAEDRVVLRVATDELMLLSGQEYVDTYAATVKAGGGRSSALDDLGQLTDDDTFEIPKAG